MRERAAKQFRKIFDTAKKTGKRFGGRIKIGEIWSRLRQNCCRSSKKEFIEIKTIIENLTPSVALRKSSGKDALIKAATSAKK